MDSHTKIDAASVHTEQVESHNMASDSHTPGIKIAHEAEDGEPKISFKTILAIIALNAGFSLVER